MRVAVVIERIDAVRGGAERSTGEFVRALARLGHEVEVWTRSQAEGPIAALIRNIPGTGPSRAAKLGNFLRGVRKRMEAAGRPDVIHAMLPIPEADIYMPRAGLVATIVKAKLEAEPTWPRRLARRFSSAFNKKERMLISMEKEILSRPGPLFVAISELVAEDATRTYGLSKDRIRTVFNGIDVAGLDAQAEGVSRDEARAKLGFDASSTVFACVTHDFRRKGVRELIAATKRLVKEAPGAPVAVAIAGRGPVDRYLALASKAAPEGVIRFLGPVDPVVIVYRAADVLVLPTWFDPCSRAVLEAIALGVPVITTARNGAAEVLAGTAAGKVVASPDDDEALAAAMTSFLDPAARRVAAEAALAIRSKISVERHARSIASVYEEIVRRRSIGRQAQAAAP
jgi:UDP-glucose:(heptosyl)LPS alpha-1,3-glucosyltransferase